LNKKKICVVINNRANYARIKSFLIEAKKNKKIDLQIIAAGSSILAKYGRIDRVLKKDKLKLNIKLHTIVEGNDPICMVKTTSQTLSELSTAFSRLKPDIVVVIADRYENLAVAIAASYMNISLAHIQGGEVTGSIDETVRHAITKLSHIHFVCTKRARSFLIKMGENKKTIFNTGCPSIDLVNKLDKKIDNRFSKRNSGVGDQIDFKKKYIVVLFHPVTTEYNESRANMDSLLKAIDLLDNNIQVIILWPNIDSGTDDISRAIRIFLNKKRQYKVGAYINFTPEDYIRLIYNSISLIGNSSSGIRESSYIGLPVVNIGSRQRNRERGKNVIDVKNKTIDILNAINKQITKKKYKKNHLYGDGNSGKRVVDILIKSKISLIKSLNYLK
jgi:UDP-hydrolysing UDP-N-acetyl-D-glucosamine 2-epimerase